MTLMQKRLLGLLVTLILGGGAIVIAFWQTSNSEQQEQALNAAAKVFSFKDSNSIKEISLTNHNGNFNLVHEKTADGNNYWSLITPLKTKADNKTITSIINELLSLENKNKKNSLTNNKGVVGDRNIFGLNSPRFRVKLSDTQGKQETLLVGIKNSFDDSLYVERTGSEKIFMVASTLEYQLDQDLFKLRNKKLLTFNKNDIKKITVTELDKTKYICEQVDTNNWRMLQPLNAIADNETISGILTELANVTATTFIAEQATPEKLKLTGLDKPKLAVTLSLNHGFPKQLLFSEVKNKDDTKYYAMISGDNPILEINGTTVFEKLLVEASTLRDLRVLNFTRSQVQTLELISADKTLTFLRSDKNGIDDWNMILPEKAKVQDATLTDLLYRLWSLKATKVVTDKATQTDIKKYDLARPALRINLKAKNGTIVDAMVFGKTENAQQYVMRADSNRIDLIEASFSTEISLDPKTYKEKQ
ncbi:MAG: DUF4340 domain-containing protein [Deltaproteobacteria bacterium]|nr:DUF4340 domain-containing protein [Deltaproteobacteria bacterium]